MEARNSKGEREKGEGEHAEILANSCHFYPNYIFANKHQQTTRHPAEKKCMSGINSWNLQAELISC